MLKKDFFFQDAENLQKKRGDVFRLLDVKGYNEKQIKVYQDAYDYFCDNPSHYDGATIVKDLVDIPNLDLDAMLHDYHYIHFNVASNFASKWKADWLFAKGNERKGKGQYSAFTRFVGLTIVGLFFVPYAYFKRGRQNAIQKELFLKNYKTLLR